MRRCARKWPERHSVGAHPRFSMRRSISRKGRRIATRRAGGGTGAAEIVAGWPRLPRRQSVRAFQRLGVRGSGQAQRAAKRPWCPGDGQWRIIHQSGAIPAARRHIDRAHPPCEPAAKRLAQRPRVIWSNATGDQRSSCEASIHIASARRWCRSARQHAHRAGKWTIVSALQRLKAMRHHVSIRAASDGETRLASCH